MPLYNGLETYRGDYATKFVRLRSGIFVPELGYSREHSNIAKNDRILEEILELRRLGSPLIDAGQVRFYGDHLFIYDDSSGLRIPVHKDARFITIEEFRQQSPRRTVIDQGMYQVRKPS